MTSKDASLSITDDIVALLKHCQVLLSEKGGVTRPTREDDPFANRIRQAIGYTQLLPMAQQLSALDAVLERQGKIQVGVGDDYAQLALTYVVAQYPAPGGTGQ
ncbi:hypothetical protein ACLETS_23235 [Enterobacter ludwigii]|uniref:hypothetical protein n=1 Tax=Enterobacter ludwigii TaxID=299767 RepID=UPI003976BA60